MNNRRGNQRDTLVFIIISIILMLIADQVIFGGKRSYIEKIKEDYYREHPEARRPVPPATDTPAADPAPATIPVVPPSEAAEEEQHGALPAIEPDYRDLPAPEPLFPLHDETFASHTPAAAGAENTDIMPPAVDAGSLKLASLPPVSPPAKGEKGRIAIIIDDVGMNLKNSRAVLGLPAPITLAFLPYAPHTPDLAQQALAAGHETMIHTPMEALGSNSGLGPMALRSGMDDAALKTELEKMFASFTGYKGINNHMGSKLTQDAAAMDVVMKALKARNLYFVDSRTIAGSVAADRARMAGIPFAARDVFLDHEETPAFVAAALAKAVYLARTNGAAIAIGHPKDVTIEGLRQWIPTLKEKGVELVPASALLTRPTAVAQVPVATTITPLSADAPAGHSAPPAPLPAVQP